MYRAYSTATLALCLFAYGCQAPNIDGFERSGAALTSEFAVLSITPPDGADNIAIDDHIEIAFSQPVDPTTITASNIELVSPEDSLVPGTFTLDLDDTLVVFQPDMPLAYDGRYLIQINDRVTNQLGERLSQGYNAAFFVESEPVAEPPPTNTDPLVLKRTYPKNGKKNIRLRKKIRLKFSQPIDPATAVLGPDHIQVLDASGTQVLGELSVHHKKVKFTPLDALDENAKYSIVVGTKLAAIDGATLSSTATSTFKTRKSPKAKWKKWKKKWKKLKAKLKKLKKKAKKKKAKAKKSKKKNTKKKKKAKSSCS